MVTEFLVFSDIHLHEFAEESEVVTYTHGNTSFEMNSRLYHGIQVLRQVKNYARSHGIEHIVFPGDLTHAKRHVTKTCLTVASMEIGDADDLHWHMIPGNHDYVDKEGMDHSLALLKHFEQVTVYDRSIPVEKCISRVGDLDIAFIPYIENREQLVSSINKLASNDNPTILVMHTGVQGAKVGADFVMAKDSDITVDELAGKFKAVFMGHYHEHQKLADNIWIVGATHHHNWGDAGSERGFLHVRYENESVSIKRVPTDISIPRFVVLDVLSTQCLESCEGGDFIKAKVLGNEHSYDPRELEQYKHLTVSYVDEEEDEELSKNVNVNEMSSDEECLLAWLDSKEIPEEDRAKYLEAGRALLL
jgi:DNA repair exonuclease SbcCD nuclease subunit